MEGHTPGKTELLGDKPVLVSLYPPQVPRGIVNSASILVFRDATPLTRISYLFPGTGYLRIQCSPWLPNVYQYPTSTSQY